MIHVWGELPSCDSTNFRCRDGSESWPPSATNQNARIAGIIPKSARAIELAIMGCLIGTFTDPL